MECVGWNRAEVSMCTALACPLFEYRPFAKERKEDPANEGDYMDPENAPQ